MKNKIAQWTIGSVLLVTLVFAGAFASCEVIASTAGQDLNSETVWLSLTPTVPVVDGKGVRTATLALDFSREISGLTSETSAEDLATIFTFDPPDGTADITVTGVEKVAAALYRLKVVNVPLSGVARVTVNRPGIAPPFRLWSVDGRMIPDNELPVITAFRFTQSENTSLSEPEAVGSIDQTAGEIVVVAPEGTSLNNLIPTVSTSADSDFSPKGAQDFSNPIQYTVTAATTGALRDYEVTVYVQTSSSASIEMFQFLATKNSPNLAEDVSAIITGSSITVTVPYGTALGALTPTITYLGGSISPENLAAQNFSSPVPYTVTAADGTTQADYWVTAAPASDTRVELIAGPSVSVFADDTTAEASFTNASGLSLSAADFAVTTGATIDSVTVDGGTATVALSFAENFTTSAKPYTVSVAVASTVIKGDAAVAVTQEAASYTIAAPTSPDLLVKFGIKEAGYPSHTAADVRNGFKALHLYLNDQSRFTTTTDTATAVNVVHLGDYIDLPALTVAPTAQTVEGTQSMSAANRGAVSATNIVLAGHGALLRLMVVGINSFNRRTAELDTATPHVVFQFQNEPGFHRMNAANDNTTGYEGSEMRAYLSGNYLDGLKSAGLPEAVLWGPKRAVWKGYGQTGAHEITDTLWLPTERELFGDGPYSYGPYSKTNEESAANQAYLEYYDGDGKRGKYTSGNFSYWYWEASPYSASAAIFCIGPNGFTTSGNASSVGGCAPAFCVR